MSSSYMMNRATRVALVACASSIALASGIARAETTVPVEPDLPQTTPAPSVADKTAKEGEVVVRGVRESLARAREKKRKADTIVDIVEAEDIGKLPNNTVGDVIASVPGIAVTRSEGEVNDIQLRGLGGVQTTFGGTPVESGAGRNASIADLPADLVKSIEVYKTRSPDQVEGAGGGSINVELRKPADFNYGLSLFLKTDQRYNLQSAKLNQVYTAIGNYRRETGIGDIGLQLGVTVNHNPFLESQARNDPLAAVQQRQVVGPNILPLPTFAPNQIAVFYTTGSRTTPNANASLQWAPDDRTSYVLEGMYAKPRFDKFSNNLYLPTLIQAGSTNTLPALSNIKLVPGTNRIQSMSVAPVNQIGPISVLEEIPSSNFLGKFTASHKGDFAEGFVEVGVTGSDYQYNLIYPRNRFVNRPSFDVDFASKETPYPMVNVQFRDFNLLDPDQYRFFGVDERWDEESNRNYFARTDLKLSPVNSIIQRIDFGMRFSKREIDRVNSFRSISGLQFDRSVMPEGYNNLIPIPEGFRGTGVNIDARWLSYDRFAARDNYSKLREFVTPLAGGAAFASERPTTELASRFSGTESAVAAYGTLHYRTKLLVPISGIIGARLTNDIRTLRSSSSRQVRIGTTNNFTTVIRDIQGTGNRLYFEPTVTAVIDWTEKLKTRLSYNVGIQRPGVNLITPFINLSDPSGTQAAGSGTAGNPDLKPDTTVRYDASFEYYFGKVGQIAINPFYWKRTNAITYFTLPEIVAEGGADIVYNINRPYNAGGGYRRGVEMSAQGFFTFLPGILRRFGVQANYTYIESRLEFQSVPGAINGAPVTVPLARTPKHVYNLVGLFEDGPLNARVSYNYNGTYLDSIANPVRLSTYVAPRTWMDVSVNYTVPSGFLKNLSVSLQVQNALAGVRRSFYGYPDQPRDVIYMSRVIGGSMRYKF